MPWNNIEFRQFCERLALDGNPAIFSNGDALEANAVIGTIYKHSKSIIRFFAYDTSGVISDCMGCDNFYYEALESFLQKPNTKLKVLIQQLPVGQKRLFDFLKAESDKYKSLDPELRRVDFRIASEEFKKRIEAKRPRSYTSSMPNDYLRITTGDDNMFRIEYDTKKNKAKFSFNNAEVTKLLIQDFDEFFVNCGTVEEILKGNN